MNGNVLQCTNDCKSAIAGFITFFVFLLVSNTKIYSQNLHYGVSINAPLHFNLSQSTGLKSIPQLESSLGCFISYLPPKKTFGTKLELSTNNQLCSYKVINDNQIKDYIQFSSKYYECSIHAFNITKKGWMLEYGFSFKTPPRIRMVYYEKKAKMGFLSFNNQLSSGVYNEIEPMQKLCSRIIPSIQFGYSYTFKNISIGSQISIDALPIFTQSYLALSGEYSINPQFMSVSFFARLHLQKIIKHVF